ncbi:STAS domain-containing protein [Streptomyces sp. NPDC048219]|uniref:STAS domain-containing protein n=1 Tax=unclassified Streptomyces TaxID=2593676 RepID=UPI003420582A
MQHFTVTTAQHAEHTVITVRGDVDLSTCPELTRTALDLLPTSATLCLDLSGVTFMDSSGLNLLILLQQRQHAEGHRLALTGLQSQPARLLELTSTYELLMDAPAAGGQSA